MSYRLVKNFLHADGNVVGLFQVYQNKVFGSTQCNKVYSLANKYLSDREENKIVEQLIIWKQDEEAGKAC